MSAWKDLPAEILDLVFGIIADDDLENLHFITNTLEQCQRTCKNWNEHAKQHIYRSITIQHPNQLVGLLETLSSSNSNPGRYLKEVGLFSWDKVLLQLGWFQTLLLSCPNVETIDFSPDANGDVFEEIQKACERGACKHLKQAPVFARHSTEAANKQYYDALYCLRNSLQYLVLDENFVVNSRITTSSLLQSLKEFPNLCTLTLRMKRLETIYRFSKCIEGSPDLRVLDLVWHPGSSTNEDMVLDTRSMTPCPTIKQLNLYGIPVTRRMLEYIMHTFSNLDDFTMNAVSVFEDSNNLLAQFLVYLNTKVKLSILVRRLYIANIPGILTDYFYTIKSNRYLNIVYRNKDAIKPYMNIDFDKPFQSRISDSLKGMDLMITANFPAVQDINELPHLKLLRGTGSLLKSLELGTREPGCSFYLKRNGLFLDHIFQQCTSLVKLTLSGLIIASCGLEPQTNTSIKHIKMYHCWLSPKIFLELSARLSSLSHLWLEDHLQLDSTGNCLKGHCEYIIEMPNTSFDVLTWIRYSEIVNYDTNINLKIVTSSRSLYFFCNENNSIAESSDVSYNQSLGDQTVLSMYIFCQDIKTLNLTLHRHSWQIYFTEL